MAIPPIAPPPVGRSTPRIFGKAKAIALIALAALLLVCLVFSWTTRSTMANLSFLGKKGQSSASPRKSLVDLTPWQTAQQLAALAVTAEENEFARNAERLADHEVDQAFAAALRQARLRSEHRTLTGNALALSQKVAQLQQLVAQDQAQVQSQTSPQAASANSSTTGPAAPSNTSDDLEVAKAQLGLDSDELADAQQDLNRAIGDDSAQIQEELAAHEASIKAYDNAARSGAQVAIVTERQHGTLAGRIAAWFNQIDRNKSILQAQQQAQQDAQTLTSEHNALEASSNAGAAGQANSADRASRLADLKDRSVQRQILSIYDDRIQTQQQLATVYGKWSAQVQLQHGIVFHLILQSLSLIVLIVISMLLCDTLVRRLMEHPALDRRQRQTLRSILEMAIQVFGVILILLVIFGTPQETPTILGLATAALTIALQDFIIAFLGWFVLVGKNGMHVGDWVEINGVGGEVTEVGLFTTSLLETGKLEDKGYPTGRRITFMNGFAIRGQYFNFSTAGQWTWDEIGITIPASDDITVVVEQIQKAVEEETAENAHLAEEEWKHGAHGGLSRFTAAPVVNLRPTGSGTDTQIRYVTRASERFDMRNRLYQRTMEILQRQNKAEEAHVMGNA